MSTDSNFFLSNSLTNNIVDLGDNQNELTKEIQELIEQNFSASANSDLLLDNSFIKNTGNFAETENQFIQLLEEDITTQLYPLTSENQISGETIIGTEANDSLFGGIGNDTIDGQAGDDYLYDSTGDNTLLGYFGNDTLIGGTGNDILLGEDGNDYLVGSLDFNFDYGFSDLSEINDSFLGYIPTEEISGDPFTGSVFEDFSVDWGLSLTDWDDNPSSWTSWLEPITGEMDTLSGGAGADTFALGDHFGAYYIDHGSLDSSYATITDFNWQEGDKFQVFGNLEDYSLTSANWTGGSASDTLIQYQGDVIGVVADNTNVVIAEDFTSLGDYSHTDWLSV